jgi:NAD-dependent deacetylase
MNTLRAEPPDIIILTGAALAQESGFSPFDPATMPAGLRLEDLVTREGFARDPRRINDFYNGRRRDLLRARPNPAHEALAVLDALRPRRVLVVTRALDDLHERAGSTFVIHTHGELLKARCAICTNPSERRDDITGETVCPVCGNTGHLRPDIVRVGEEPRGTARVYEALAGCRLFLAIGVPIAAEPTLGFAEAAKRAGARRVAFTPEPSADPGAFDEHIVGPLTETVPAYVKRLIAETR